MPQNILFLLLILVDDCILSQFSQNSNDMVIPLSDLLAFTINWYCPEGCHFAVFEDVDIFIVEDDVHVIFEFNLLSVVAEKEQSVLTVRVIG